MFDVTRHEHHRHEHHTTVREVRAPTDESVRLLREMEQAAQSKVDNSVRVENCPIDMVVHEMTDHLNARQNYKAIYKINGHRREVFLAFDVWKTGDEIAMELVDSVARDIAVTLLAPHLRAAIRNP